MIEFEEIEGVPGAATIAEIEKLYLSIFGSAELGKFEERLRAAENSMTVLARRETRLVGFKIGFQIEPHKFYSWIGGVDPAFREKGIAAELMKRQHAWCAREGFTRIRTKTKNCFKSMLILNLKSGFDVVEAYADPADGELKIVLEKKLAD